jgi:transmembrane sensor
MGSDPVVEPVDDNGLLERAIDWVALLRSGRATEGDAERLQRWRAQSPAHEAAFRQAARLYRDLGSMGAELERRKIKPFARPASVARHLVSRRALIGGALAASVAGYMVVKPPLDMWPSLAEMSADYRTAKGEQLDVALADNVSLKLNTQTSIAVRGTGVSPRIELISGEAAINSQRLAEPLVVLAADGQIVASNGEVNIRCIDGVVMATCIQGSITVTQGGRSVQLQSGQQISYSSVEQLGAPIAIGDPASLTAWREKLLVFKDKPLATVVSEINRYRPGKIVVTNSGLGQRLVNGTFHTDKLDDFVAQVRQLYAVKVRALPGGVVLLS